MRWRIVGQQNADVDPDIEDFDERVPHGLPDAEVKCLDTEQSQLAMAANTHLIHVSSTAPGIPSTATPGRVASSGVAHHQITRARTLSDCGMLRLSAFAVLPLMNSSKVVGW